MTTPNPPSEPVIAARQKAAREVEGDSDNPLRVAEANAIYAGQRDDTPVVQKHLAEPVVTQEVLLDRVEAALLNAKNTFFRYARLHNSKGTNEGREKAAANDSMGDEMVTAIMHLSLARHRSTLPPTIDVEASLDSGRGQTFSAESDAGLVATVEHLDDLLFDVWEELGSPSEWPGSTTLAEKLAARAALSITAPVRSYAEGVEDAMEYAVNLATVLREKHYPEVNGWKPSADLMGVLLQIDNMASGLVRLAGNQDNA